MFALIAHLAVFSDLVLNKSSYKMKKIEILTAGYGHFKISTEYRGKTISTTTTNTHAIDRYRDDGPRTRDTHYTTQNLASVALYNEIVRANYPKYTWRS